MITTPIDFDSAPTAELRRLCRSALSDAKAPCLGLDKMNRHRLRKRLDELVSSGAILRIAKCEETKPDRPAGQGGLRHPLPESAEQCFISVMEALRCYARHEIWLKSGRGRDPQTKKYLEEAREHVRQAVSRCVDRSGRGWDKGYRIGQVVDSALVRLRYDFADTMTASSVMSALLSDEATEKISGAGGDDA